MYTVYLGVNDVSFIQSSDGTWSGSATPPSPGIRATVSNVIRHPNYYSSTIENDIALVILQDEITPNEYIKIACLPEKVSSTYPPVDQACYVSGWVKFFKISKTISIYCIC